MMSARNIYFEMAERSRAVNYGGIGAMHLMGQKLGLAEEINGRVQLLKRHLPYQESDHVLNLAYNALLDGLRLEDIELVRPQPLKSPCVGDGDFTLSRRVGQ